MQDLVNNVKQWVRDRHLHTAHPHASYLKFQEEAGELAKDIARNRDCRDSIGDVMVTLISLCECLNVSL